MISRPIRLCYIFYALVTPLGLYYGPGAWDLIEPFPLEARNTLNDLSRHEWVYGPVYDVIWEYVLNDYQ